MRWAALFGMALSMVLPAGSQTEQCGRCHPAETKLHERTRMAHAMLPARTSPFGENLPGQPLRESADGYSFSYRPIKDGIEVTSSRGLDHASGTIEWVLGAGAQGETPLVKASNGMLESRVSYFPQLHRYGVTVGQEGGSSANAIAALGHRQSSHDLQQCIECHASGITPELEPVTPGIQCERCHSGSEEHVRDTSKLPFNPGKLTAAEQVRFCGSCHRVKPPVDDAQPENVRFQPLRLMKSRCFTSGRLACTTCHPAHQDAKRNDAAFYDNKCHACHDSGTHHADSRQTGDCISCHMPYVELHPALKFTDHYIRVVRTGDFPAALMRFGRR